MPKRRHPSRDTPKPREGVPRPLTDKSRGKRLQKVLAEAGVASRRDSEELILAGRVKVNGDLVTALPAWVDPDIDRVEVDGEPVRGTGKSGRARRKRAAARTDSTHTSADNLIYVAVNNPKHVISTTRDPQRRTPVTDLVDLPEPAPGVKPPRLFPVGRLDADSTGLILLTNDGDLTNHLTHPRYGVPKQYRVTVRGRVEDEDLARLQEGLVLADGRAELQALAEIDGARARQKEGLFLADRRGGKKAPQGQGARRGTRSQVRRVGQPREKGGLAATDLLVTLREGQNREIRRMLARLGFKVRKLHRVKIGPISVKGLAIGQWRRLSGPEVQRLRKAARMDRD